MPMPSCLTKTIRDVANVHDRRAEEQRRGGDDPARCAASPLATASSFGSPASWDSLIRAEQEDAVVGREREGDGEEEDRLREVECPSALG